MRVLCAWCCRQGLVGYLGAREPRENPETTHGVCAHHKAELLESLPSRSFPGAEFLIVVRRGEMEIFEGFRLLFATTARVEVILDRRVADRRVVSDMELHDRRARRRRLREGATSPLGDFTVVRFTPKAPPAREPLELH